MAIHHGDDDTEESQVRADFNAENGAHIPADICLCIENPPTRWEVVPWAGDIREVLPEIDADLLTQVSLLSCFSLFVFRRWLGSMRWVIAIVGVALVGFG